MREIYDILRQREADCARVRKEIQALRFVIPLLDEEGPEALGDDASASLNDYSQSQILSRRNLTKV